MPPRRAAAPRRSSPRVGPRAPTARDATSRRSTSRHARAAATTRATSRRVGLAHASRRRRRKTRSWTAAGRVTRCPTASCVIGFQDGDVGLEARGQAVRAAAVGPDPSPPPDEQITRGRRRSRARRAALAGRLRARGRGGHGHQGRVDLGGADATRPLRAAPRARRAARRRASRAPARARGAARAPSHGSAGFAVPQGTPTNNTDDGGTGYSRGGGRRRSYDDLFGAATPIRRRATTGSTRRDGQWLAEALGIDYRRLDARPARGGTDRPEARAMNSALWPATFGYMLETMLHPVLDAEQSAHALVLHALRHGRGPAPVVRIGNQPYGILPTTAFSRWTGSTRRRARARRLRRRRLRRLSRAARTRCSARCARTGGELAAASRRRQPGDPHQLLLDILGLHPGVGRVPPALRREPRALFNRLKLAGLRRRSCRRDPRRRAADRGRAAAAPARLHRRGRARCAVEKFFFAQANRLNGPVVDDRPLSETDPIRAYTADGATTSRGSPSRARVVRDLRLEQGFTDDQAAEGAALPAAAPRAAARLLGQRPAAPRGRGCCDPSRRAARREPPSSTSPGRATRIREPLPAAVQHRPRVTGSRTLTRRRAHRATRRRARRDARVSPSSSRRSSCCGRADGPARALPRRAHRHRQLPARRLAARASSTTGSRRCATARRRRARRRRAAASTSARTAGSRTCGRKTERCSSPSSSTASSRRVFERAPARRCVRDTDERRIHPRAVAQPGRHRRDAAHRLPRERDAGTPARSRSTSRPSACAWRWADRRHPNGQRLGALLGYRFERGLHDGHPARARPLHLSAAQGVPARRRPAGIDHARADGRADRGDRGAQRGRRPEARRARRATPATAATRSASTAAAAPTARPRAPRSTSRSTALLDLTTRSPISRWPRACTRPCSATTTAPPRRSTRTRRAPSRPSRTSSARRAAASRSRTASGCTSSRARPDRSPSRRADDARAPARSRGQRLAGRRAAAADGGRLPRRVDRPARPVPTKSEIVTLAEAGAAADRPALHRRPRRRAGDGRARRPHRCAASRHARAASGRRDRRSGYTARLAARSSVLRAAPLVRHLRSLLLRSRPLAPTDIALTGEAKHGPRTSHADDRPRRGSSR